jgi:hypothetical protein
MSVSTDKHIINRETKPLVIGHKGAIFKSFKAREEAEQFVHDNEKKDAEPALQHDVDAFDISSDFESWPEPTLETKPCPELLAQVATMTPAQNNVPLYPSRKTNNPFKELTKGSSDGGGHRERLPLVTSSSEAAETNVGQSTRGRRRGRVLTGRAIGPHRHDGQRNTWKPDAGGLVRDMGNLDITVHVSRA